MGVFGSIGGAVGGYLGSKKDKDYASRVKAANERARKSALKLFQNMKNAGIELGDDAIAAMLQAWRGSMGEIDKVGRASRQDILEQGQVGASESTQHLMNTGLYNTTAAAQARGQSAYQTSRSLADLGERLAGLRAGTMLQGAAGYAGALQNQVGNRMGWAQLGMPYRAWSPYQGVPAPNYGASWGAAGAELGSLFDQGLGAATGGTGNPWGV